MLLLLFQGDLYRCHILDKALVHVLLIGNGTSDNAGLKGELHNLLELSLNDAQVAVGDPVGRVAQDKLQDVRFLIEEIRPRRRVYLEDDP